MSAESLVIRALRQEIKKLERRVAALELKDVRLGPTHYGPQPSMEDTRVELGIKLGPFRNNL